MMINDNDDEMPMAASSEDTVESHTRSLVPIDPKHDVVAKCKNGKLHRPTGDIYVIVRVQIADPQDIGVTVLAYSYDPDFGTEFVETIACREVYDVFWDFDKDGSPCFDPIDDNGNLREIPEGKFMMWDEPNTAENEDGEIDVITKNTYMLTIYDNKKPITKYIMAKATLSVMDLMAIETEGDRFFLK